MNINRKTATGGNLKLSYVISLQKTSFEAVGGPDEDIAEKLYEMAALGFDGAELAIRNPSAIDTTALKRAVELSGLSVPALGTGQAYLEEGLSLSNPDGKIRKAAVKRIQEHIDLAAQLKSLVIIGLIRGNPADNLPGDKATGLFKESLVECLGYAAEKGATLALEPISRSECSFINSLQEGTDFIKEMGHPALKLLADTYHMNAGDENIRESLTRAAPRLAHVHFADSNRCYPGSGDINFREIVATLREIGYNGYISAEVKPEPSEAEAMRGFLAFMRGMD